MDGRTDRGTDKMAEPCHDVTLSLARKSKAASLLASLQGANLLLYTKFME